MFFKRYRWINFLVERKTYLSVVVLATFCLHLFFLSLNFSPFAAHAEVQIKDWEEIKGGGQSLCARGGEFSFFYNKGKINKVVIDFMGGGACWSKETCFGPNKTYFESIDELRETVANGADGIYNRERAENPFKDWHHIIIPYCTGDIHWGANTTSYAAPGEKKEDFTIYHRGATNAQTVLQWIYKKFSDPDKILVTGCSAGSYGSIYWAPHIKKHYSNSKIYQLGDSGAGVITKEFSQENFPRWNPVMYAPKWIPGLNPDQIDWFSVPAKTIYQEVGKFYPELKLSQFNSMFDANQVFYYELMGGSGEDEWTRQMKKTMISLAEDNKEFKYFIAPGENHCVLPYESFYTQKIGDEYFSNWVKKYINDQDVPSLSCQGLECDPINN